MKKRVLSFLDSKYIIILALVPALNVAYLLFRLLFVKSKVAKIPIWYFAIIAVPAVFLYNVLPDLWGWCVTHFIISAIAALYMYKSRGCYNGNIGFNSIVFWGMLVILILAISINMRYVHKPAYSMGAHQEILYEALNALADNDREAWIDYIHPEHGQNISNIDAVRKRFAVKIAALEGGFEKRKGTVFFSHEAVDGRAAGVHVYVVSKGSGQLYIVSAVWEDCEHGSGLVMFDIKLA